MVDILGYTTLSRPFPLFPPSVRPGVRRSPFYSRLAAMTWSVSEIQPGAPAKNQPTPPRFPHKATYIPPDIPLLSLSPHCIRKPSRPRATSASRTNRSTMMNPASTPIDSSVSFKIPPPRPGHSDRRPPSPQPRSILPQIPRTLFPPLPRHRPAVHLFRQA